MIPASAGEAIRWTTSLGALSVAVLSLETLLAREAGPPSGS